MKETHLGAKHSTTIKYDIMQHYTSEIATRNGVKKYSLRIVRINNIIDPTVAKTVTNEFKTQILFSGCKT